MDINLEKRIIELSKNDISNFLQIYESYVNDVYRYIYSKTNDKDMAEDITSGVFIKAMENINNYEFQEGKSIKAWLFVIGRNIIYSKYKKESSEIPIDDEIINNFSEDDSILNQICDYLTVKKVINYIDNLDEETSEIIKLKIWQDMSFEEIAYLLNKNVSTIKMRYYRVIKKIKDNLLNN